MSITRFVPLANRIGFPTRTTGGNQKMLQDFGLDCGEDAIILANHGYSSSQKLLVTTGLT